MFSGFFCPKQKVTLFSYRPLVLSSRFNQEMVIFNSLKASLSPSWDFGQSNPRASRHVKDGSAKVINKNAYRTYHHKNSLEGKKGRRKLDSQSLH